VDSISCPERRARLCCLRQSSTSDVSAGESRPGYGSASNATSGTVPPSPSPALNGPTVVPIATAIASSNPTAEPPSTPRAQPSTTAGGQSADSPLKVDWTLIVGEDVEWSPDSAHFAVSTATATEIRDRGFNVVQTFEGVSRAGWLDDTRLAGYIASTKSDAKSNPGDGTSVIVTLGSDQWVTTDMPVGFTPRGNGHGAAAVQLFTDPRSYNDGFVVWSPDAGTTKKYAGFGVEWSNDGSKLAAAIRDNPFSWAAVGLSWPEMSAFYKSDRNNQSASPGGFDPSGHYLSVWSSLERGYDLNPGWKIVYTSGTYEAYAQVDESHEAVPTFAFWTADPYLSIDDGQTITLVDLNGREVSSHPAPLPIVDTDIPVPTASKEATTVVFASNLTPQPIAVVKNGVTTYLEPPIPDANGNQAFLSPDGSLLAVLSTGQVGTFYLTSL